MNMTDDTKREGSGKANPPHDADIIFTDQELAEFKAKGFISPDLVLIFSAFFA